MNKVLPSRQQPLNFLKLLAHDLRWQLLGELARSDLRVGELVDLTARPQNLVSYHLGQLRDGGLVREQRSSADGRDVYYCLDVAHLEAFYRQSGEALHPALVNPPVETLSLKSGDPPHVLFLCTHNSARSQMAEAFLNNAMGNHAVVASAGSQPSVVHRLVIRVMAERGIDLSAYRSKHMAELLSQKWDWVITVCDRVCEVCPIFPQDTMTSHWSVRDPAAVGGGVENQLTAFRAAADEIENRVRYLAVQLIAFGSNK